MVTVSILVLGTDRRTPLFIAIVGAEIGNHNNDTFTGNTTFTAAIAGRCARGGQVVAFPTAAAAPGGSICVKESLRASGSVYAL